MARIKHSTKQKDKILLNVVMSKLSGNKLPYLSVDIKQVKLKGETVHGWQEQKEAIRQINPELGQLVDLHLSDIEKGNSNPWNMANYYRKKVLQQLANPITETKESLRAGDKELETQVKDHELFDLAITPVIRHLKEYSDKNSDMFKYKNFSKSAEHWKKQLTFTRSLDYQRKQKALAQAIDDYFNKLDTMRQKERAIPFAKNQDDVWTIDRFCQYLQLTDPSDKLLILDENVFLQVVSQKTEEHRKESVKSLEFFIEKYNIETVHG